MCFRRKKIHSKGTPLLLKENYNFLKKYFICIFESEMLGMFTL